MSLQVWLPLIKDLRNQGLDNITVTTANTNSFQNEGKLSNKSLDVSGHYAFRVPSLVKKRVFSCAFWYKPITDSSLSDNWRRIVVFDTYTSDGSTTGAIFRFESSYGYQTSSTTYCISIHNNIGEPIASIGTGLGSTDGWNKWQHIAITADGTTLRCYRNGVQIATGNMNNGGMLQGTVHIGYSGNRPIGRLNDFRLYDHCLSQMEVKEISKGLVLHYPLSDKYIEAVTNLSGGDIDNTCYNATTSKYNYGTNTDIYKTTGTFQGRNCTKVYMGTAGQTCYPYVHFTALTAAVGGTRTLGFDYYPTKQDKITFYTHGTSGTTVWSNGGNKGTTTGTATIPVTLNQWNHIRISVTNTGSSTSGWGYMTIGNTSHTSTTTDYWLFDNVMIVEGSIEKPFVSNNRIANTITYDCSGFCNNGIIVGSPIINEDTSRYNVSTKFNGSTAIKDTNFTFSSGQWTLSFWYKYTTAPSAYQGFVCLSRNTGGDSDKKIAAMPNSSYIWMKFESINYSLQSLKVNEWCHIVMTCDGNVGKVYENGVLKYTTGSVGTILIDCDDFVVGGRASSANAATTSVYLNNGSMSDVRLYATALSAEDVLALYHTASYIDKAGNNYVYQYIET